MPSHLKTMQLITIRRLQSLKISLSLLRTPPQISKGLVESIKFRRYFGFLSLVNRLICPFLEWICFIDFPLHSRR